jgi:hypothetical protein
MAARARWPISVAVLALLAACQTAAPVTPAALTPSYLGAETERLDKTLVAVRVALHGARDNDDVDAYGRCAAAGDALSRGFGYARHIRTIVVKDGDIWRGDAVYTMSATLPQGFKTIDAEAVVRDCGAEGIPTV